MLALPGGAYVYQGEELGLAEVEDLPDDVLKDPAWVQSGHTDRGRDGCRVPLPWSGDEPPFGFSPPRAAAAPWLPQPPEWRDQTVQAQTGDGSSMLELYRRALRLRRTHPALGDGQLNWLPAPAGTLAFAREPGFACVVNLSAEPVAPPDASELIISSDELDAHGRIPGDAAAWFSTTPGPPPSARRPRATAPGQTPRAQ
jgi:alpha-glucosidase